MTVQDFYDNLEKEDVDTIEMNGLVLANSNKGKYHICKKGPFNIKHACGNGSPSTLFLEKNAEVVEPKEALEKDRVCTFCQNILEREFNLDRMVIAVSDIQGVDVDRFIRLRQEALEE